MLYLGCELLRMLKSKCRIRTNKACTSRFKWSRVTKLHLHSVSVISFCKCGYSVSALFNFPNESFQLAAPSIVCKMSATKTCKTVMFAVGDHDTPLNIRMRSKSFTWQRSVEPLRSFDEIKLLLLMLINPFLQFSVPILLHCVRNEWHCNWKSLCRYQLHSG